VRLPSGVELVQVRRFSGLDRLVIRQHHAEAEHVRARFALAYAVVGIAHGIGNPPAVWSTPALVAYGEWVCLHLETSEDAEALASAVLGFATPIIVAQRVTVEAVDAAGKSDAPPAGA